MKKILYTIGAISIIPAWAFAANQITDATSLITKIDDLVNATIWLFVSLAVVFIVWNGVQFIMKADSEDRKAYQNAVLWGIVGLFVILSIWGLVNILANTLNVDNGGGQSGAQKSIDGLILKKTGTSANNYNASASTISPGANGDNSSPD